MGGLAEEPVNRAGALGHSPGLSGVSGGLAASCPGLNAWQMTLINGSAPPSAWEHRGSKQLLLLCQGQTLANSGVSSRQHG